MSWVNQRLADQCNVELNRLLLSERMYVIYQCLLHFLFDMRTMKNWHHVDSGANIFVL